MKNRVISIIIAITLCLTCAYVLPASSDMEACYAKAKTTYVKVKKATYNKMKKTIASQKKTITSQKKTIASQKNTISKQSTAIQNQSKAINSYKETIANQKLALSEKDNTIKDKKSTISWLWETLEDFGFSYNYDTHQWEGTAEPSPEPQPLDWADLQFDEEVIPLMEEQTGLVIDQVQIVDNYRNWTVYYVDADGDLYIITMKKGTVDVCQILN